MVTNLNIGYRLFQFSMRPICPILFEKFGDFWTNGTHILRLLQNLHINIFQRCSIVAMTSHKAVFDAGEIEGLIILVVIIFCAEVFVTIARGVLLEESGKVLQIFLLVSFEVTAHNDNAPVGVVTYATTIFPETDV